LSFLDINFDKASGPALGKDTMPMGIGNFLADSTVMIRVGSDREFNEFLPRVKVDNFWIFG
jgi:hypothetical protein